jgi:hypothetical protein
MPVGLVSEEEVFSFWVGLSDVSTAIFKLSELVDIVSVTVAISVPGNSSVDLGPGWWLPVQDSEDEDS